MTGMCESEHIEIIDPRIREELENLNSAAEEINSMEVLLGEERANFHRYLNDATAALDDLGKRLGSCIEKSRPYHEARINAKELHRETQTAAVAFERANSNLATAKEMVDKAEQECLKEGHVFDSSWQEMLNHCSSKVNEAETRRIDNEAMHLATAHRYEEAEQEVKRLQRSMKRNINKSRPYFEKKIALNIPLIDGKSRVENLERIVSVAKKKYSAALKNLEMISEDMHFQRQSKLGERIPGVGAESNLQEIIFVENPNHKYRRYSTEVMDRKFFMVPEVQSRRSLPEEPTESIDPHSILEHYESVDHLDNISDTTSILSDTTSELELVDSILPTGSKEQHATTEVEEEEVAKEVQHPPKEIRKIEDIIIEFESETDETLEQTNEEDGETITPSVIED